MSREGEEWGEPGEPGEPGQPGTQDRGGAGGVGGEGGEGGTTGGAGGIGGEGGMVGERGPAGARGPRGRPAVVGFLILIVFCGFAAWRLYENDQALHERDRSIGRVAKQAERLAEAVVHANREGCRRTNVLRENQARVIEAEMEQTATTLRGPLNGLERFRLQIEQGQDIRREALRRLRRSTGEHRTKGSPYKVDCATAYPE